MCKTIYTPIIKQDFSDLDLGEMFFLSGKLLCGRDAVLPKIVEMISKGTISRLNIKFEGMAIFHSAVSSAGVGPTSSNKPEIENSMETLSKVGVRIHIGKGKIQQSTIQLLDKYNSIYAIVPPVSALLKEKIISQKIVAFEELGMEALYLLEVESFPAMVAGINRESIYD